MLTIYTKVYLLFHLKWPFALSPLRRALPLWDASIAEQSKPIGSLISNHSVFSRWTPSLVN